ncbi:MAG: aminoacyl-tRNA hydrolase [Cyanobacteria bacterium REEB67]|nr:aminoacyl-tRNA hydrolase [Cyanobacteria bacterium REEB67]
MKVVVGLGNPGREYEDTRHNAGFRLVDQLATAFGAELKETKSLHCLIAKTTVSLNPGLFAATPGKAAGVATHPVNRQATEEIVLLVKPTTYMNLSGRAVRAVLDWYKIDLGNVRNGQVEKNALLIVHDDVSLNLGRIRCQAGRGAGGQHGVESIIEHLSGSKSFERLKLGVGPDPGGAVRGDYLLSKFRPEERIVFERVLEGSLQAVKMWLCCGTEPVANEFNGIDYSI